MGIPLIKRVRSSFPKAALFVMYGQTEATARISYLPPQLLEHKPGSVGFPVKGLEVQLRREGGLEATESGPGEIWVRGPSIMQGYWRDQETTGTVLREGWLNTGDLGYRDADGCLYVVGRRSDMIKTGAHRVHPAEVEEVLLELPGVAEAAAVGVEDDLLGESIKVCIVPQAGAVLTLNAVKAHCRSRLASHKVPKHLQIVASLPKTSSGKLMRASLRASVPRTST